MPKQNLENQLEDLFSDAVVPDAVPEPAVEPPVVGPIEPVKAVPASKVETEVTEAPPSEAGAASEEGVVIQRPLAEPAPGVELLPEPALKEPRPEPPKVEPVVAQVPAPEDGPTQELVSHYPLPTTPFPSALELARIRRFLAPPVFEGDEDKTRVASLLNTVLLVFMAAMVMYAIVSVVFPNPGLVLAFVGVVAVLGLGALFLMRRGNVRAASLLFVSALWSFITVVAIATEGVSSGAMYGQIVITVIAGLLVGGRGAFSFAGLSIVTGLGMLWAENSGLLPLFLLPDLPVGRWAALSLYLAISAAVLHIATSNLNNALQRARRGNRELQAIRVSLEQRVADRTRELDRRSTLLQAAAEVSRVTSSILESETLVRRTVNLIRDRFDYYYVGIFILDAAGRWAVLRAGTGEAGREMLAQGHKLGVGGDSMIGWCTAHRRARIALDVGEEAVRFDNPLLPDTRSEMALPLISRGRVIGALTVQSTEPQAFSEQDVAVLQTMADQVANAIENARLLQETERLARRNQLVSQVSAKLRGALGLEEILQTTVRELGLALGASEAVVRLGSTKNSPTTNYPLSTSSRGSGSECGSPGSDLETQAGEAAAEVRT